MPTINPISVPQPPDEPSIRIENRPPDSRPSSSASNLERRDEEDYAGEVWGELDAFFRAQDVEYLHKEQDALLGIPLENPDAPSAAHGVNTSEANTFNATRSHQQWPDSPCVRLQAASPSPSLPSLRSIRRLPQRPLQELMESNQHDRQSLASPHQNASSVPQAAASLPTTGVARASPSNRFYTSPDQIDALARPRTWILGQVISTLGDLFCYETRSNPRYRRYEVLSTDLFGPWKASVAGEAWQGENLKAQLARAASPLECRA